MPNTNRPKAKLEESNSVVFNDQENSVTDKPAIEILEERIIRIESRLQKAPKTTFELLSTRPEVFIAGLIIGVILATYIIWDEKAERKELKRELIEYCDKVTVRSSK